VVIQGGLRCLLYKHHSSALISVTGTHRYLNKRLTPPNYHLSGAFFVFAAAFRASSLRVVSPITLTHRLCQCSGSRSTFRANAVSSHCGCQPSKHIIPTAYANGGHAALNTYHPAPSNVSASSFFRNNAFVKYETLPSPT